MKYPVGFDNEKYLQMQTQRILERVDSFGGKLYMEFGGKLFDDYHASRVLPGFEPDSKMQMLLKIRDEAEIVIAINANDIEKNKKRGDLGISYDLEVLRLINAFRTYGLYVSSVVFTHYANQPSADKFEIKLKPTGVAVYHHYPIADYPMDAQTVVSERGLGKNDFILTSRPIVVVTAPGPGSGKMATCLSQLYHDFQHGRKAGYAKFETFPVWNLPLNHPVNLAYEAATVDLADVNMIDHYHLAAYGETAVNYNRDIEIFPVLETIFKKIYGTCPYKSPTDMGVNMVGYAICDEAVCRSASGQEVIRRYLNTLCDVKRGDADAGQMQKLEVLMNTLGISVDDRPAVAAARLRAEQTGEPAAALELPDGTIVTGRTSALLGSSSAALLNALKKLARIDDSFTLLSPAVLAPIQKLKTEHLGSVNPRLHIDEVLLALSICAVTNPLAELALHELDRLHGCQAHTTVILSAADISAFRKLGIQLTSDAEYQAPKPFCR